MKIAYILTSFPSKSENFALREMLCLKECGHAITVMAACKPKANMSEDTELGVRYRPSLMTPKAFFSVVYLLFHYPLATVQLLLLSVRLFRRSARDSLRILFNIHAIGYFAKCLKEENIEHIHAYFLSWPACIGLALSKITAKAFSISAHARDIFVESGDIKTKVQTAKFVVTCTEQGCSHIPKKLPVSKRDNIRVVRHGIDLEAWRISENNPCLKTENPDCKNLVLAVGRLVPKKGFVYLIEAFKQIRTANADLRLVIAGDGSEYAALCKRISFLGLSNCVDLIGWTDQDSLRQLFANAAILVVPSVVDDEGDRDGTPNVILEAFASGVPVIASRLPGIEEAIGHMNTGFLVEPGDHRGLAEAIQFLLQHSEIRAKLSQQALEFVKQQYDLRLNVEKIASLFEKAYV